MVCNLTGFSVHGISQARILEWVAISFSRASSRPRDGICISYIGRWILYHWATREAQVCVYTILKWPIKQFSENSERPCKSYFLFEFCYYGQRFYHCFHNWMEVRFQETQLFFWDIGAVRYVLSFLYSMLCYAKSLQSCPTLCDPIDGSLPGSPIPGIL